MRRDWLTHITVLIVAAVASALGACTADGRSGSPVVLPYGGMRLEFVRVDSEPNRRIRWAIERLRTRLDSTLHKRLTPLLDSHGRLMVATGRLHVGLTPTATAADRRVLLARAAATATEDLGPSGELWSVVGGLEETVARLVHHPAVGFVEPELAIPLVRRQAPNDPFFAQQWHLSNTGQQGGTSRADVQALEAWQTTRGSPDVMIAIIDDGIDPHHEDLHPCRVMTGPDLVQQDQDATSNFLDFHGTACAGIAAATVDNHLGVAGVCPECRILGIRLFSSPASPEDLELLASEEELVLDTWAAQALTYAVDLGADILSNSWGPPDLSGDFPLPEAVRAAVDYANDHGRGGLGAPVLFAAGNGGEDMENDGFASYDGTIAVGASTNRDESAAYSDHGEALDVVAPSAGDALASETTGIWTADGSGRAGSNPGGGAHAGDRRGHYTNAFGGTSAATPLAAGVLGLMLSVDPELTVDRAREILRSTAAKINEADANYDDAGHSLHYGYGRVDAAAAVAETLAQRTGPAVGIPCTADCGDLLCVQGLAHEADYCSGLCATSGECPDGYECATATASSGESLGSTCVRLSTCPEGVELCGDGADNDGNGETDEGCGFACTAEGVMGRCEDEHVVACEAGDVLSIPCPFGTTCGAASTAFATCFGCGTLGHWQSACAGNTLIMCITDHSGRKRLARLGCPELCATQELDDISWGRCVCDGVPEEGYCAGDTLVHCFTWVEWRLSVETAHRVETPCEHGCRVDEQTQIAHCTCEEATFEGVCDGDVLAFCEPFSGQPERVSCPHGCAKDADGLARCMCGLEEDACIEGSLWACDRYGDESPVAPCVDDNDNDEPLQPVGPVPSTDDRCGCSCRVGGQSATAATVLALLRFLSLASQLRSRQW